MLVECYELTKPLQVNTAGAVLATLQTTHCSEGELFQPLCILNFFLPNSLLEELQIFSRLLGMVEGNQCKPIAVECV